MTEKIIMTDSHLRSIIKGISWRVLGTIDTITMAFMVTGEITNALKIGFTEVITKIVLYYIHERTWNIIPLGRIHGIGPTHSRSFIKGVSWRVLGTIDTITISYFITGHITNSLKIGGFEVFSKIVLFYIHERIWGKLKWGRIIKTTSPSTKTIYSKKLILETEEVGK